MVVFVVFPLIYDEFKKRKNYKRDRPENDPE